MERKIINVSDFQNVARNNEYFLWHFIQKEQKDSQLIFYSFFDKRKNEEHNLKEIIDLVGIPYFESYVEDGIDFLNGLGIPYKNLWYPNEYLTLTPRNQRFNPIIIGFNKFNKVSTTMDYCYCTDGILNVIGDLNPEILLSVDTED